jgi:Rho family protein
VAHSIGARAYKECSALRNEGVDAIFENATRAAMLVRNPSGATGHQAGPAIIETEKRGNRRRSSGQGDRGGGGAGEAGDDGHGGGCSKSCVIL